MKRTSDVTILGTVVYGVSISTTTFTLRSRTSLGSTQMNNQSKASKSDLYWVMTSEKRSPTYVVYHFDTQRLSPTRVCKKKESLLLIGKSNPCGGSGFPLSLSEWSFTTCLTPYNRIYNVLSASLKQGMQMGFFNFHSSFGPLSATL